LISFHIINLKAARLTEKLIAVQDMMLEDLLRYLRKACDFIKISTRTKAEYLHTITKARAVVELWL
jgi:hypothetical protein